MAYVSLFGDELDGDLFVAGNPSSGILEQRKERGEKEIETERSRMAPVELPDFSMLRRLHHHILHGREP